MVIVTDELVEKVCYNSQLPWTLEELSTIAKAYEAGKSIRAVAALVSVSYPAAHRALHILGVAVRPSNHTIIGRRRRPKA